MVRTNRLIRASGGLAGGAPGALSKNILNPETEHRELPRTAHMHMDVKPGDRIHHIVSGSGGHGNPLERDPAQVLADVQDEKLSVAQARDQYGVVIDAAAVNMPETEALRATRLQPVAAAD